MNLLENKFLSFSITSKCRADHKQQTALYISDPKRAEQTWQMSPWVW